MRDRPSDATTYPYDRGGALCDDGTTTGTAYVPTNGASATPSVGPVAAVPEPSTMLLGGLGIVAFVGWFQARRRRAG